MQQDVETTTAEKSENRMQSRLNNVLASLVIIFTIFTAYVSYQATVVDAAAGDLTVEGQRLLSDADLEAISVNQFLQIEYRTFDNWVLAAEGSDEETYYFSQLSDDVQAAMEASEDGWPFNDAFYTAQYAEADSLYDQADQKFQEAQETGDKAVAYQAVVLTLAVGLAFAAWASLADETQKRRTRWIFTGLSILMLVVSTLQFLAI